MRLAITNFSKETFEKKLAHLKDVDFSLYLDSHLSDKDNSKIKILVLQEPNEYFGLHDYAIENKDQFSFIITWDYKVLNNCDNAVFLPFGHTWLKANQYKQKHNKSFKLAHLRGNLLKTYGHQLRHELLDRQSEIKIPTKFFPFYGERYDIEKARIGKEEVFSDCQFGVAIENVSHKGYFSEKILDLFLLKTIPVYWGCSDIEDFFNKDGIIKFENVDDLIATVNNLGDWYYYKLEDIIEENYQLALQYVNYEQNVVNKITEIFKHNNLI